ncbi:MAG: hypothetical protein K1W24_14405 [Lachnospiraceae bacterium]
MGDVISFQKAKEKKEEKFNQSTKKTQTATEKATKEYPAVLNPLKDGSSIDVDYADMEPEDKIEYWKNIEKEEEELVDCLGKIIEICPEKKEEDKTEMLYQAARLFELQDLLSDLFYKEVMKD